MAFEAVDLNAYSHVTGGAKEVFIVASCDFTRCVGRNMTVDTLDQASLFIANSLPHGFIALVEQHRHMVSTHFFDWCDAGLALWGRNDITFCIPDGALIVIG